MRFQLHCFLYVTFTREGVQPASGEFSYLPFFLPLPSIPFFFFIHISPLIAKHEFYFIFFFHEISIIHQADLKANQ